MTIFVLVALLVLLLILYKTYRRAEESAYNLPPGPRGLPLLGNNHQLAKNAPQQFCQWTKEYGKLYTIRIGNNRPALVVSDTKLMKQLFGSMASTGKFESEILDVLYEKDSGVVNTEGRVWQEQREFCVKTLKRAFSLGRGTRVESMVLSEVEYLGKWMEKEMSEKGEVHLSEILKESSGNTLWCVVTGERMNNAHLVENWMKAMQKVTKSGLIFFPWVKYIAPELSGYKAYVKACKDIHIFMNRCFQQHKSGAGGDGDVISAYLDHLEKMKNNTGSSFVGEEGYRHSVQSVNALLMAGTETTATTLHWLIFYLCVYPNVQEKVRKEIEEEIGNDRDPMLTDRRRMPYSEAVIHETLRFSTIAPFGLIHRLLEDVTFGDYKLPKNLLLIPNIYHVHYDTEIWGDPENFRPERFLEKAVINNESAQSSGEINYLREFVIPFQLGRRICLGEAIARDIIFLFLSKLLKQYKFSLEASADKNVYMEPEFGYILAPKNLGIKISRRQ